MVSDNRDFCILPDDPEPGQCGAVCELPRGDGGDVSPGRRPGLPEPLPQSPGGQLQPQPVLTHVQPQYGQSALTH